ncbi:MAG: heme NO-binding domain-containing protein [Bacteroidales bacterium]|nr:heme NO-binding domain-containing protein [Bacteroidales bacterium]
MKGLVFTEFMEMVEQKFGFVMADEIVQMVQPASGGVYTGVGTYPSEELVALVVALHKKTGIPVPDLIEAFGRHLFLYFLSTFSHFFETDKNTFSFLSKIEGYIHVEVKKLYPDAELPHIKAEIVDNQLILLYKSNRRFSKLAEGLMKECAVYYKENIDIHAEYLKEDGSEVKFTLIKS